MLSLLYLVGGVLVELFVVVSQDGLCPLLALGQLLEPLQVLRPPEATLVKVQLGEQQRRAVELHHEHAQLARLLRVQAPHVGDHLAAEGQAALQHRPVGGAAVATLEQSVQDGQVALHLDGEVVPAAKARLAYLGKIINVAKKESLKKTFHLCDVLLACLWVRLIHVQPLSESLTFQLQLGSKRGDKKVMSRSPRAQLVAWGLSATPRWKIHGFLSRAQLE